MGFTFYRICLKHSDRFCNGKRKPKFSTQTSKVWLTLSKLIKFLSQFVHHYKYIYNEYTQGYWNEIPENWEVVIYSDKGIQRMTALNYFEYYRNRDNGRNN